MVETSLCHMRSTYIPYLPTEGEQTAEGTFPLHPLLKNFYFKWNIEEYNGWLCECTLIYPAEVELRFGAYSQSH